MAEPVEPRVPGVVRRYVALARRRPVLLMAITLALTAALAWPASRLELVTDLGALLPQDTPSVRALDESNRRVGSTDLFTIAIESSDLEAIAAFQDALASAIAHGDAARGIEPWPDASWVQVDKPTGFFKDHALLYIPREDLEDLRDHLEDYFQIQAARIAGTSLLDEDEEEEARRDLVSWFDPDLPDRLGMPDRVGEELRGYFEIERDGSDGDRGPALPKGLRDRLISAEDSTGVVLVRMARPSTDIDYAEMALERGGDLIERLGPSTFAPDLRAEVVGGYRSFKEVEAIGNDAKLATLISLGLVMLLFLGFFRRFRSVVIVVVPLAIGCAWMLGLTGLTYGRLTSITAFVVAMLIGMGIDYGIHLYSRAVGEVQAGRSWEEALGLAISSTGRGLASAAATTIASLLTLLAAHFKGFFEYGIVASYGIVFCFASAVLVVPPLTFLLERVRPARYPPLPAIRDPSRILGMSARRLVLGGLAFAAVLTALTAPFIARVGFEYDFRNLRGEGTKQTIHYGKAVGKDTGTSTDMILGASIEEMRLVHRELTRRKNEEHDQRLRSFLTIATFVPTAAEQEERIGVVGEIAEILGRKAMRKVKDQRTREMLDTMEQMTRAGAFGYEDLPDWVVEMFTETDGSVGKLGYIYERIEKWDARQVMDFQDDYGQLPGMGREVPVASSNFILADVVRTVRSDSERLAVWIMAVILLIIVVDMRNVRGIAASATALAVGSAWTAGLMGLYDIRLGLYNIIVIPTVLGVAIDGSIHIVHRYRELGREGLGEVLRVTGRGVLAAALTTAGGFTGLVFIQHRGLRTIGTMAVAGVLATMVAVLLVTPALCWLLDRRPRR
jgi:predicted RND superfamily exporter protein